MDNGTLARKDATLLDCDAIDTIAVQLLKCGAHDCRSSRAHKDMFLMCWCGFFVAFFLMHTIYVNP